MNVAVASPSYLFQRFSTLVYLLVAFAFAGFAYADNNPPLFAIGFGGLILSWLLVEGPRGRPLPKIVINLGVLAAAAVLLGELVFSVQPNLLIALSHFIIGIILCKLFERKGNRDYGQILTLSLLTIVAAAISSSSFAFSCLLILYLAFAGYAILIFHLRIEAEPIKGKLRLGTSAGDEVARIRNHLRMVGACAAVLLVLCTAIIFLAIPRLRGQDLFNGFSGSGVLQTGFSDRVQLFDNGRLQQSDAVVMEVTLMEGGTNIGSETNQPYFRGTVLDTYNPNLRRWERSDTDSQGQHNVTPPETAIADTPIVLLTSNDSNPLNNITSQYVLREHSTSTLFTIAPPMSFTPDADVDIVFNPSDFSLTSHSPLPSTFSYSINSAILYHPPKSGVSPFLETPGYLGPIFSPSGHNSVSPQIMNLAHKIVADIVPAEQKPTESQIRPIAERIDTYLQQNYPYNLSFKLSDNRLDPTTDFLVNHQKTGGYCEHFASAMVMLCRSMGLNARMVTGFHGGDFNTVSGAYVVRQKYAHTWVEVFIPDSGWVRFDPTPGDGESTDSFAVSKWFSDIMEIIQRSWLSTVVSFDNSSRTEFFNSITAWLHSVAAIPLNSATEFLQSFVDLFFNSSSNSAARWTGALSIFAILILTAWLLNTWQRRRTSQLEHILKKVDPRVHKQLAHELHFFDDLIRILAKTGVKKSAQQTPREYVEAISARLNGTAEDARWLVDTFYDIRFGAVRASQVLRLKITAALQRVRQNIHHPPHG